MKWHKASQLIGSFSSFWKGSNHTMRINLRARELFEFLRTNQEQGLTRTELKAAMGWSDYPDYVFAGWLKEARRIAVKAGLLIPMATYANGFTYTLTNDPAKAFQPALQAQSTALGMKKLQYTHDDFMGERIAKLPKSVREIVQRKLEFEAAQRAIEKSYLDNERAAIAAIPARDLEKLAVMRRQ